MDTDLQAEMIRLWNLLSDKQQQIVVNIMLGMVKDELETISLMYKADDLTDCGRNDPAICGQEFKPG